MTEWAEASKLAQIEADWEKLHAKPPATLHHYTPADGLLGILRTSRLWATNARFMNDPSEIQYATALVEEILRESAAKHKESVAGSTGGFKETIDKIVGWVQELPYKAPKIETWARDTLTAVDEQGGAYIACFCKQPDLLSQWRGYAAAGGGYAVGFASRQLSQPGAGILLRRVIYDPKKQREMVRRWVGAIFALDQRWRKESREARWSGDPSRTVKERLQSAKEAIALGVGRLNEGLDRFGQFLAECLVCFKNPAYREEQEWRLIQFGKSVDKTLYRTRGGHVVPYVELDVATPHGGKLPIRRVTHGPLLDEAMAERGLKMALRSCGYADVVKHVAGSMVPYRG